MIAHRAIRAALNSAGKVGLGATLALYLAIDSPPWVLLLAAGCLILAALTQPLPDDKIERELILERELDQAQQKAILDALAIENLQQCLATATKANQAMEQQFQSWASQAELQGVILRGASQRFPGA